MNMTAPHIPIMVEAVVDNLITDPDGIYLDGTVGFGGHAEAILKNLGPGGQYIGMDADPYALEYTKNRLSVQRALYTLHHVNYRDFPEVLASLEIPQVTGLFFDLGISSFQVDSGHRGFAFQKNAPLDMRFNPEKGTSAQEFLNSSTVLEIGEIIRDYGEERHWRKISRAIFSAAEKGDMETTFQLKSAVSSVTPDKFLTKSLARVFQAIRIHINQELEVLKEALILSLKYLQVGGRIGFLTFHSLEDRMVKQFFKKHTRSCVCPREYPVCICNTVPKFKLITRKAIIADAEEVVTNSRSRSAKLRIAERI
jgi:16S rRNA (cytosine1402-N4)-methyltransferase